MEILTAIAGNESTEQEFQSLHADRARSGASRCPYHAGFDDARVLELFTDWMKTRLNCAAGRREYLRGRYVIEMARRETVPQIFERFTAAAQAGQATACLYVFNNPAHYKGRSSVADAFSYLAEEMEPIGTVPAEKLAKGAALTNAIRLRCPVTNQVAVFDDFECIAFCPQSDDRDDPLYDPLLYAPFTAVNMSSDVYAFSRFVADSALALAGLGKPVYEEKDVAKIAAFFDQCVERWHRVAMSIIERFEAATDTALCPVHVTAERTHWIAGHKDPAFAEDRKEAHSHELPVIYGKRLVQRWLDFFQDERPFDVGGLARDGVRTGEC